MAEVWPGCVIQWEDFKHYNALRILDRYRDRVPSFNDDVQGTAAVVVAGVLAAMRHLGQELAAQRILLVGAGAAGVGIARLMRTAMADADVIDPVGAGHLALVDSHGLIHDARTDLDATKRGLAIPADAARAGGLPLEAGATLASIVEALRPTILVGTTGIPGTFTEAAIRAMAASCPHPIILPLSNPTANTEATPADVLAWTDGRAVVATGSPFPPVERPGRRHTVGQANNVFVFPGLGLGTIVSEARRITDGMVLTAARTLAEHVDDARFADGALYPSIARLRDVSRAIALAVAREAIRTGEASPLDDERLEAEVDAAMWWPAYVPYRRA